MPNEKNDAADLADLLEKFRVERGLDNNKFSELVLERGYFYWRKRIGDIVEGYIKELRKD